MSYSLILHGGAGIGSKLFFSNIQKKDSFFVNLEEEYRNALYSITDIGNQMLKNGSNAIDVVEKCCIELENNELFNAGIGSSSDIENKISHEAIIVDGKTLNFGGICNSNQIKNPIKLAKLLLSKSIIISGNKNIKNYYIKHLSNKKLLFTSPQYFKSVFREKIKKYIKEMDTIGVVARDIYGNIASGSSTGGLTNRPCGRLGDTHMNGISTIADNRYAGIVVTGHGENIIKHHVASNVFYNIKYSNISLKKAINKVIKECPKCGIIGIDNKGNIFHNKNTDRMYVGMCSNKLSIKISIWD